MSTIISPCRAVNVPGPQGPAGAAGTSATDGINAFSLIDGGAVLVPAYTLATTITLKDPAGSRWMALDQIVFVQAIGFYQVIALPSDTQATILNLGYPGNINAGGVFFPDSAVVAPAGLQGPAGALGGAAGGDLTGNYPNPTLVAVGVAGTYGNSTTVPVVTTDANGRVTGVTPTAITFPSSGTPTGAAGGDLTGTYPNPTLALTGVAAATYGSVSTVPQLVVDTKGRITSASSVQPRIGLLGSISSAQLQTGATDIPVAINSTRYVITEILIENASAAVTTASGGVFSGAGGTGVTVAADQVLTALSATTKFMKMALSAGYDTILTGAQVQFRVGTGEGSSRTVRVWVFGFSVA